MRVIDLNLYLNPATYCLSIYPLINQSLAIPANKSKPPSPGPAPDLDSGRGGAEVWTTGPVDREEYRELKVLVQVTDAGGLLDTHALTVIIDDLNDNPMRPASKTVYLWKTEVGV